MRTKVLAMLIILLFGAARLHFEQALTREHRAAFFHTAELNLDMRERLGQMGFVAALSGFRAILADLFWIQGQTAFERTEWGSMKLICDTVTSLQPRAVMFWDLSAWHMAWNAGHSALWNENQPREALRLKAQLEYWKIGEDFLLRGIQNNPDKPFLYEKLGFLYKEKFRDHAKAYEAYEKCAQFRTAPEYCRRFALYELAQVPGREREAYDRLMALYRVGESERLPTLLKRIQELEEKLSVPVDQRIYIPPSPP